MPALAKHYAGELQSWHLVRNPREKAVSRALAADRARQATAHPKAGPTAVLTVPAAVLLMGAALRAIVHPEAARLTGETVKAAVLLTVVTGALLMVEAAVLIIKADSIAAAETVANAMAAQGAALGIAGAVTTGAATTVSGRLGTLMQEAGVMLAASSAGV